MAKSERIISSPVSMVRRRCPVSRADTLRLSLLVLCPARRTFVLLATGRRRKVLPGCEDHELALA